MRFISCCAAALLLSACSFSPMREAWNWDATRAPQRVALSTPELADLTNRIAALQLQRNEIRNRISGEPDIWARQRLYEELHGVGVQLSPLERQLALAAPAR